MLNFASIPALPKPYSRKKRYPYNITCITLLVDLHKDLAPFWKLSIFLSYQYCRKFQPLQKPSRCQILLFLMTSHHDALLSRLGVQQLLLMYKGCCVVALSVLYGSVGRFYHVQLCRTRPRSNERTNEQSEFSINKEPKETWINPSIK